MNIHHLELFYYVAKHGGISEAVRNMPYGIQQPAISAQVANLEEFLGTTLFRRRPFQLTAAGEELFEFIKPFFSNLNAMSEKLCGGVSAHLRVGASETILRDHLPDMLLNVRKKFPQLKLSLRQGYHHELLGWLDNQELDLAVTLIEGKPPTGINSAPLLTLPLVLLVRKNSRITSAEELWNQDRIEETLISLPPREVICKHFQQGLGRMGVDWFPAIEVSSLDLIEIYVANGFGAGLGVGIPQAPPNAKVRVLPLNGFEPVVLGALWQGKLSPVMKAFLSEAELRAKQVAN